MPGLLCGKRVAIVGNGPGGSDCGSQIDSCDFVVRMSRWDTQGPKYAGVKVNAICGCNSHIEVPYRIHANRDWEIWCNEPPKDILANPEHAYPADWRWLLSGADGRAIRIVRNCVHEEVVSCLRAISLFRKNPPRADIGSVSIAMALDLGAEHIELWGIDRTGFGKPNDNWAQEELKDPKDQVNHDYRARAFLIADLVDKGLWCGRRVDVKKVVWHGRPETPKLEPDPEIPE